VIAHRPKTAALIAYADDLLSPAGRSRIERHIAECDVCHRELAAIVAYTRVLAEASKERIPEVDFDRMELALAREAERLSNEIVRSKRSPWAWVAVAIAAAVLLAVYLKWPHAQVAVHPRAPTREVEAPLEVALLTPVVTLAASATRNGERLHAGDAVHESDRLAIADGVLHVRLHDGTGFVAEASSELALTRARENAVGLTLNRGRLDSEAAPLAAGSTYVVLCDGYRVEVRGTRFAVSRLDGIVGVDLERGHVVVSTPDGHTIDLRAPASWRSSGASGAQPVLEVRNPTASEVTPVTLAHDEIVRWEVDGSSIASRAPVELFLPSGEHRVRGWNAEGRAFGALLPVGRAPVALEPTALEPEGPHLRPGNLPVEEIQRVLSRGRGSLQQCYERTMRLHDVSVGRLRLRVHVGVMGDVHRATVLGAEGADTAELRACITAYAERWTFPPPGGPVTFELPLSFGSRPNPE
jgi:ferric-dicitrate binding protein FerR (iron transport regulator)